MTKAVDKSRTIVAQSNSLVEAHYDSDLTATEHKILRYAAARLKNNSKDFPTVTFSVREFLDAGGLSGDGYHKRIETIANGLSRKSIKIKTEKHVGWFPWLASIIYGDGQVHLTFNNLLKDLLLDLGREFTWYDYKLIGGMRSAYTIRLFELLRQYAPIGRRTISLELLKNMLGTEDKYKHYGQFKLRVLQQAQKELEEQGELTFDFNEIKQGRQVAKIEFIIKSSKKMKLKLDSPEIGIETFIKEVELLLDVHNIKIPRERLSTWSKYGTELLNDVLKSLQGKDINNYPAYIEKILESKYEKLQAEKDNVKTGESNHADLLVGFINSTKSKEVIPEFMLRESFSEYIKEHIADEDVIEQLWNDNEIYILDRVALYLTTK